VYDAGCTPFARILREADAAPVPDGAIAASGRIWGTYVHGIFDDDAFRHAWLGSAREFCSLPPVLEYCPVTAQRDARIDRWAEHLRHALDLDLIRRWIGVPSGRRTFDCYRPRKQN
jgi:adenosylcobyric acid synthase